MRFVRITILSILLAPTLFIYVGVLEVKAQTNPDIDTQFVCAKEQNRVVTFKSQGQDCQTGYTKTLVSDGVSSTDRYVCLINRGTLLNVNNVQCDPFSDELIAIGAVVSGGTANSTGGGATTGGATITALCANADYTKVAMPGTGDKCAQDYKLITGLSVPANDTSVCTSKIAPNIQILMGGCSTGQTKVAIDKPIDDTQKPADKPKPQDNKNKNPVSPGSTQVECPGDFVPKGPLCVPKNPFEGKGGIAGSNTLTDLIVTVIKSLLWAAGIIAVLMVIFGGYQWMTASSNETQRTNGRKTLTNALIGLVIVMLAYGIISLVTNVITKGL